MIGDDERRGVTEAGHAVLDRADKQRAPHVDFTDLLRWAQHYAGLAMAGNLDLASRREAAILAAACAILAIEAINTELGETP